MDLPLPSEVVALVTDSAGEWCGTAFFVSRSAAVTCAHVIKLAGTEPRLLSANGASLTIVEILPKKDHDLALIIVDDGPDRPWLPFSRQWAIGAPVVSHGFSERYSGERFPLGHPMDLTTISGTADIEWEGRRYSQVLRLGPSNADSGFSGGPLVDAVTGSVLGVLFLRNTADGGLYAVPASTVLELWPNLEVPGTEQSQSFSPRGAWLAFDPGRLHCVVIESEAAKSDPTGRLSNVVKEIFATEGAATIWNAFRNYWSTRPLLKGSAARDLPEQMSSTSRRIAAVSVSDVFTSRARLADVIRLVVEADVAFFDMSGFEPGVMLLLGIRAATRRGVTVTSHGGWEEGSPLDRPFNLVDLSIASHRRTMSDGPLHDEAMFTLLSKRITSGFEQLDLSPLSQDLPAYRGFRDLGSRPEAWSTIPLEKLVIVMCSYDHVFYANWRKLRREISNALFELDLRTERVARLIDLGRPQLVSQALYEHLRRCSACVTDWSGWSPSTFFELGARLAVSTWGSVSIVDEEWLAREEMASTAPALEHHKHMGELFRPLMYRGQSEEDIGQPIAAALAAAKRTGGVGIENFVRNVVVDAIARVQEARQPLHSELLAEADSLHHPEQGRLATTQVLFPEIRAAKIEQESAALERRIATWLYLDQRLDVGDASDDDPLKQLWRDVGNTVVAALYGTGRREDLLLAGMIERKIDP